MTNIRELLKNPEIEERRRKGIKRAYTEGRRIHHYLGKHLSKRHREKIGEGNKGKIVSEEHIKKVSGENNYNWKGGGIELICPICGKKFKRYENYIKKTKIKCCSPKCYAIWRSKNLSGEKSYTWKDGKASGKNNLQAQLWKKTVLKRDSYTCQICHKYLQKGLIAHHINSFKDFPELRYKIENGLTVCRSCHIKIHQKDLHKKKKIVDVESD